MNWMFALVILLSANLAEAANWYVAASGGNNSDCNTIQNQGSPAATLTFARGCQNASPLNGQIRLLAGTHSAGIDTNTLALPSGTSYVDAPSIVAYPDGAVVEITGTINIANVNLSYFIFKGFIVDGGNPAVSVNTGVGGNIHHVKFENMEVRNATGSCVVIDKFVGPLNNIWWTGGKVHDCSPSGPDYAFYFNGDDQLVENVEIYNVPNYCFHNFKEGGTPLRMIFRNNVVHHCSASRPDQAAVLLMGTNPRAYNNLLYSNSGNGIMTYTVNTSGWLIDNNTVYGSGQRGIYIRTGSGTGSVRNNIVFNNSLGNIVNEQGGSTTLTTNWTSDPLFVNVSNQPCAGRGDATLRIHDRL
jgi:hypothetical protein